MTARDLITFYQKRKSNFDSTLIEVVDEIKMVSNLRILVAVLFLILIYFGFKNEIFFYVDIPLVVVFIFLVARHSKLYDKKVHLENLVKINDLEAQAQKGNISGFQTGAEFIDAHHPYSHDLDIFGDGSLFQAINRCNTIHGKHRMAQRLIYPLDSPDEISSQQQGIQELVPKTDFRQHFQAAGMEIDEQRLDRDQLLEWLRQPSFIYGSSLYRILLIVLPVLTFAALILT